MKSFLHGAFIAFLGPLALAFRPVRQQLRPILIRKDDQRIPPHER